MKPNDQVFWNNHGLVTPVTVLEEPETTGPWHGMLSVEHEGTAKPVHADDLYPNELAANIAALRHVCHLVTIIQITLNKLTA